MSELTKEARDFEKELADKDETILNLKEQLKKKKPGGMSGYVVTSPNAEYDGRTLGFKFSHGMAFVPDTTPNVEMLIKDFQTDFLYDAKHVDDFDVAPAQLQEDAKKSVSEMFTGKRA